MHTKSLKWNAIKCVERETGSLLLIICSSLGWRSNRCQLNTNTHRQYSISGTAFTLIQSVSTNGHIKNPSQSNYKKTVSRHMHVLCCIANSTTVHIQLAILWLRRPFYIFSSFNYNGFDFSFFITLYFCRFSSTSQQQQQQQRRR